eukprot:CAMPEP_0181311342 /NCGR_PEP_ID=MMETSP1101-20121128/13080_1 /TAXON_ID=46948 /ORGANISM="Rhodomonas abbreviata, Strain Caron Lab Isolate" /LENGTH=343 /DNA_ID=CAMNT_0023418055 /DNA_START=72 /DNA_END=1103 /DNA_ORIENTATION=-
MASPSVVQHSFPLLSMEDANRYDYSGPGPPRPPPYSAPMPSKSGIYAQFLERHSSSPVYKSASQLDAAAISARQERFRQRISQSVSSSSLASFRRRSDTGPVVIHRRSSSVSVAEMSDESETLKYENAETSDIMLPAPMRRKPTVSSPVGSADVSAIPLTRSVSQSETSSASSQVGCADGSAIHLSRSVSESEAMGYAKHNPTSGSALQRAYAESSTRSKLKMRRYRRRSTAMIGQPMIGCNISPASSVTSDDSVTVEPTVALRCRALSSSSFGSTSTVSSLASSATQGSVTKTRKRKENSVLLIPLMNGDSVDFVLLVATVICFLVTSGTILIQKYSSVESL